MIGFSLFLNFTEKQPDGDVTSAIRNSLSSSLNNGTHNGLNSLSGDTASLQNQLAASSKLALMSPVDYEEVNNFNNSVQDVLKSKYIVLKPQPTSTTSSSSSTTTASNASATITSNCTSINGKSLINGLTTDKINNGIGNFFFSSHSEKFPSVLVIFYLLIWSERICVCVSSFFSHLFMHLFCVVRFDLISWILVFCHRKGKRIQNPMCDCFDNSLCSSKT